MRLPTIETPSHVRFLCQKTSKVNISLSHPGQWRGNRWRAGWVELYKSAVLHITADWFSTRLLKATLKVAKTRRGTVTLFENIIYSMPQNPLKNCLFQKRHVSKNTCVFICFCFVCSNRMLISTATQMTTQLLISIEHLFELNAQHVQRVSAPFIDFTVIFVIHLFQTKKQNTSIQSTKRSVSKKTLVEVKL